MDGVSGKIKRAIKLQIIERFEGRVLNIFSKYVFK